MTYIKTTAGKLYSALCANACTIKSEDGIIIKEMEANKQDYFVAPEAYIQTDDAGLVLTECFNEAPIGLVAIGGVKDHLALLDVEVDDLQNQLNEVDSTVNTLTSETIPEINASIDRLEQKDADLEDELKSLSSEVSQQLDDIVTDTNTRLEALDESLNDFNVKVFPDWSNAIALNDASFPYTAPRDGWIIGGFTSSSSVRVTVNNILVALAYSDFGNLQLLINEGDVVSGIPSNEEFHFVPCKGTEIDSVANSAAALRTELDALTSTSSTLGSEIDALESQAATLSKEIDTLESELGSLGSGSDIASSISSLNSSVTSLQSQVSSLSSTVSALQSSQTSSVLPKWSSAVTLSPLVGDYSSSETKSLLYTAPSNGWIVGWGYRSAGDTVGFYINDKLVANDHDVIGNLQVLISQGDVVRFDRWTDGNILFVPCKG